ncbi:IS110 family transposase [Deinococcus sp. QL22]|nr:IS110 family transposase [Deinococcus sp. QL22]UQN06244.1 IS110 family transposase [Deinococcus sp. QL22]
MLAGTVLAEVGDIKRFEDVHHFASYRRCPS